MKLKFAVIALLLLFTSLPLLTVMPTRVAQGSNLQELIEERDRLKRELESTRGEKRSIEDEIAYTENQIRLNELEVQDTQGQIQSIQTLLVEVGQNIEKLNNKLELLDGTIKKMNEVADARIRDAYKLSRVPEFGVLVQADNFTGALKTYQYMKELEAEDARILGLVQKNRQDYVEEKKNLENLKAEKISLNNQLEANQERVAVQLKELDSARDRKADLLQQVEGEESNYSRLLAMAQAQIDIMTYNGSDVSYNFFGHFERGQVVGFVGNTGCSTGPHAHYSYTTYYPSSYGWTSGAVDPMPRFYSGELYWVGGPNVGMYTNSPYGWRDGGFHNGADIPVGEGNPLYAAKSGTAYLKVIPMGAVRSFCPWWAPVNGPQKEIHLVHDDGSGASIYAHISDIASP